MILIGQHWWLHKKRQTERSLSYTHTKETPYKNPKKAVSVTQGESSLAIIPAGTLILDCTDFSIVRKCCCLSHLVYGLLTAPLADENTVQVNCQAKKIK